MGKQFFKNTFFFNTTLIIISGFFIKILGLINKIIITRYLGTDGMTLYIMSFPTIILFLNLSTLNINNCISKMIAEATITQKYSTKKIITSALKITLLSSILTIIGLLILINPLVNYFLKNQNLFWPLLTTIILIPLTAISDTLKGYYNGLKQITKSTIAGLIEQISRIIFVIIFLQITIPYGIIVSATFTLLALSFGELCSVIYLVMKFKKENLTDFPSPSPSKELLSLTIPSTLSKLIGSFTYFLEPIIYTWILTLLKYQASDIQTTYTIINAYSLPLLTTASFISIALSTTIIPSISENYALNKKESVKYLIDKLIIFSLVPSLLISLLLFMYPKEFMNLIYGTTEGTSLIKPFIFYFTLYYLQIPFMSILHAIGKTKTQFFISTFFAVIRLILIILLSFFSTIGLNSIFFAVVITMVLNSIVTIFYVIKYTNYQINYNTLVTLALITFLNLLILNILEYISHNFFINSIIISILFIGLCFVFNLIDIKSLKRS